MHQAYYKHANTEEPVYAAQWEPYRELHIVLFDHQLQEINEDGWIHYPESRLGAFDVFVDQQLSASLCVEPFKNKGYVTIPISAKAHQVYVRQGQRVYRSVQIPQGEEDFLCGTTLEEGNFQMWDYEGNSLIN